MPRNQNKIDYSRGFPQGFEVFASIQDPRNGGNNLKGAVVTIDAMGTQRAIAGKIVGKGGDYILSAKGNQGRLHDEIRDQFAFALRQLDP